MTAHRWITSLLPLLLVAGVSACGDDDDADTADTVAEQRANPVLTFDGAACVHDGPDQVVDGMVTVEFVNESDGPATVFVARLDEGHTADEVAELMGEGPTTGAPPPWVTDMGGDAPVSTGETTEWQGVLDAGDYVLVCSQRGGWFGGGLTVVEG